MERQVCHDCGVKEGELHKPGCDMEFCASCGGQLIWCECECPSSTSTKERVPFILYPNLCAKCGTLWPEMFMVPNEEWKRYIEPRMRGKILCEPCYRQIKKWIRAAQKRAAEVEVIRQKYDEAMEAKRQAAKKGKYPYSKVHQ